MTFRDTRIEYERSTEAKKWLDEEVAEQVARYEKIVADMEALNEQREKWYEEFIERIQDTGFNADGDMRTKIAADDIPVRPKGPHKVVY